MAYKPKTSMEYVDAMNKKTAATGASKRAAFNQIKASAESQTVAMNKIGQGFIGPIMMRLKYEGIVRNILTEDPIAPGAVPVYDVADEMGKAYFLEPYQAEAVISLYEGKRVPYGFRHLAEFATVQEQDFLELTIDMAEYALNEARQRIQEKEDTYLIAMLDAAVDGVTSDNRDWAGLPSHELTLSSTDGVFTPQDFYAGAKIAIANRLEAKNVIMNPGDVYDLYALTVNQAGVIFRDKTTDGTPIDSFAGFNIFKSVMVEPGTFYMLANADYVGRMPVRKSLEVRNNDKIEAFSLGWVLDEFFNEIILNSGSITRCTKTV